jgi:hypothetical protein
MHQRRRLATALSASALLVAASVAGAAPAHAASGSYHVSIRYQVVDGYSKGSIIRASGASGDTLKVGITWRGSRKEPRLRMTLQRKIGSGAWKTVKRATRSPHGGYTAKLAAYTVPAERASQKVAYRFTSTASAARGVRNTAHSKTFTVTYENPAHYVGLAKTVHDYIAPYCGTVAVHEDPRIGSMGYAGVFQFSRGITIDSQVAGYPPEKLQSVALHECAHYKQFTAFGRSADGDDRAEKRSPRVFVDDVNPATGQRDWPAPFGVPFDAYEHAADCASHALQPAGYLGYGGYCNPSELAAGLALITRNQRY